MSEGTAFLEWSQWLLRGALAPAPTVILNLDETAVERLIPHRQGHVLPVAASSRASSHIYERIARRATAMAM